MIHAISQFLDKKKGKAVEYKDMIEGMLNDYDNPYSYAEDTLRSILEYIEERGEITEGQIIAINNIHDKPNYNK